MNSNDWDRRYEKKDLVWSAGPNQFVVDEVSGLGVWCRTPDHSAEGAKHPRSAKQGALKTDANSFGTNFLGAGRVLDVACGEGRNALWLCEQGWQVTAFDYSSVAIDKARTRSTELGLAIDWQVADATTDIQGEYDLILFIYLHLPAEQTKKSLALASDALAPGGTLLLIGHDARNIKEGIGGPQDPSILFGPNELRRMLPRLTIERAETVKRSVDKNGVTHHALDVLIRATK